MKRVLVIGSSGAGKSTFSRRLGEITGIKVIHLDKLHWRAGWVEPSKIEWRKTVEDNLKKEAWIMDGNYSGTLALRYFSRSSARRLCLASSNEISSVSKKKPP
jgi:adenylate kinase family enzyme